MTRARHSMLVLLAVLIGLAWSTHSHAAGAVNIATCQILDSPNTTYKLTTDLQSCEPCFVFAADKITLDLQGHSITSTCFQQQDGIQGARDLTVIKNGTISGYYRGIALGGPRATLIGVIVRDNDIGMMLGAQALVKSCEASGNTTSGIVLVDRGQVQQCNVHHNGTWGILITGDNCLVTQNTLNANPFGIQVDNGGDKCTLSYNTVNNSSRIGIEAGLNAGTGHLVTRNVVLNSGRVDYSVNCPSDVSFNTSTNGFPTSYDLQGSGCKTAAND